MILGIGIDTVDVARFIQYSTIAREKLLKMFSPIEIDYCISKKQPAVHFAGRFAAKEAFLKAYQSVLYHYAIQHKVSLLTILKTVHVINTDEGAPQLIVNWLQLLPKETTYPDVHVTITNTTQIATAMVIIEQIRSTLI